MTKVKNKIKRNLTKEIISFNCKEQHSLLNNFRFKCYLIFLLETNSKIQYTGYPAQLQL